jgi:tetratricopeptide (TPR) repeat protein
VRLFLATVLVAISTLADAKPGALRDEAVRLFESQDYARAAEAFQQCYQVDNDPACLYGLGQAYRAAGDCTRAIAAYRAFLRTSPPSEPRQKALLNIAACEQSAVESPTPPTPTGPSEPPPAPKQPETRIVERAWYRDRFGAVLAVGALAAAATGSTFLVLAGRDRDAAEREGRGDGMLQIFEDHRTAADRKQRIGTVALAGASALAIAAVLRYALHDRTETVTVSWSSSDGARSFALSMSF